MKKESKAEEVLAVLREDYLSHVKRAFSELVDRRACQPREALRVPIQVVLMIPMPSCC